MILNSFRIIPAFGLLTLLSGGEFFASAQPVTNAAGLWNYLQLSTPAWLAPQFNLNGAVIEIWGRTYFKSEASTFTVQPDGSFTGPVSGTFSWGGPGWMIATVPDKPAVAFALNTAADFAFTVKAAPGPTHDLGLLLKAPVTLTTNDFVGTWKMVTLGTPSGLGLQKNGNNVVTEVDGRQAFHSGTGTLTVAANGTFVMDSGQISTGFLQPLTNGLALVHIIPPAPDLPFTLTLSVNASKNVMAALVSDVPGYQELDLLLKQPASTTPEQLQGLWHPGGFLTPAELILQYNGQGEVNGMEGGSDFEIYNLSACVGHTGGFTMPPTTVGQLTVTSPGTVSVTQTNVLGETEARTIWVNSAHDVFVGTATSAYPELLIATRTPPLTDPAVSMGLMLYPSSSGLDLYWASAPNRFLQTSTNLAGWATLTNSAGQGRRGIDPSGFPQRFYRLLQTP